MELFTGRNRPMDISVFDAIISLRAVMRHNEKVLRAQARQLKMSPVELLILLFLQRKIDRRHAKDIASDMRISKGRISEALDALEEKRMLSRVRNEEDRRKDDIVLTEAGKERAKCVEKEFEKLGDDIYDGIGDEEKAIFAAIAAKMKANVAEDNPKEGE